MKKSAHGSISIMVLVFGVVFSVAIGGLVLVAATQYTSSQRTQSFERALAIAEAGIEYYRWHLAHDPDDYTDGTGGPGPYVHQLSDPYGNTEGAFSLEITPPEPGSTIVTIESTGWLSSSPEIKRTVVVDYGRPSLAKYAFLHNANVWFGNKATVHGKIRSNGGIRMDGTHDSTVQSAKETYTCGLETGCWPSETKPGVWGAGGPQELWEFPVTAVDFNSLAADFSAMKTAAQTDGLYLPPSGNYGYHLTFTADDNVTVTTITRARNKRGWSVERGCENLYQEIQTEEPVGTYAVSDTPIIFAEDHLWVEGHIKDKLTVAAARFPLDINSMNIWINDNLTYETTDGTSGLGLVAQENIIYALDIPDDFVINAAMIAQRGNIIRHHYNFPRCSNYPQAIRQSLTIYGALISNQKSYWTFGSGSPTSGFIEREITYDPNLYFDPPPYFPTQSEFEIISWQEQ